MGNSAPPYSNQVYDGTMCMPTEPADSGRFPLCHGDDSVYEWRTSAGFSGLIGHFRPLISLQLTHSA